MGAPIIRTQILPDELTRELIDGRIGIGQLLRTRAWKPTAKSLMFSRVTRLLQGKMHRPYLSHLSAGYSPITVTERFLWRSIHTRHKNGTE